MADRVDDKQVIGVWTWIAKYTVMIASAYTFQRLWTTHPLRSFGLGLGVGVVLQYLIPPRGKPTVALWVVLFLAVITGVVIARL
jgi:hypothetical protein